MTTDNRTENYDFPLPNAANSMLVDVGRIAEAITDIDTAIKIVEEASLDATAAVNDLAAVATSGSYNDLTNKPAIPPAYSLPVASETVLGGVKIGAGLSKAADGTVSVSASNGSVYDPVTLTPTSAGQTVFTVSGGYVPQAIALYRNGVRLTNGTDYTATDGNTVVMAVGLTLAESLVLDRLSTFSVADAVTKVNGKTATAGAVTLTPEDVGAIGTAFVGAASGVMGLDSLKRASPQASSPIRVANLGNVSGAVTVDLSLADEFIATITGVTTFAFSNAPSTNLGQFAVFKLTNAGAFGISWPAGTKFPSGSLGTLTAAGVDKLLIDYDFVGGVYNVAAVQKDIK